MKHFLLFCIIFSVGFPAPGFAQQEPPLNEVLDDLGFAFDELDEIYLTTPTRGLFIKTADKVEVVLVAKYSFGTEPDVSKVMAGYYFMNQPDKLHPLFTCGPKANDQYNLFGLPANPHGPYYFDPGTKPFGFYVQSANFNPDFTYRGETVYTRDQWNRRIDRFGRDIHKARIYPYKTKTDERDDWFVICWEFSTNNDFQDLITVVRNVKLLTPPKKEKKQQSIKGLEEEVTMR